MDKQLLRLILGSLTLFSVALLSVYISNLSSVDAYEGKPAFPMVEKKINDIDTIVLKNHDTTLTFKQKNGLCYYTIYT